MVSNNKVGAVIVAAGESRRMGGVDKILTLLGDKPILAQVVGVFEACESINQIVIVLSKANIGLGQEMAETEGWTKVSGIYAGGNRRQDSVASGLKWLDDCGWVVIHDAARPLVTERLIRRGLTQAKAFGAAVAAAPVTDTIKIAGEDMLVRETPLRSKLWAVQTPQVFKFDIIERAYKEIKEEVTDDAQLVEKLGLPVRLYMGDYDNIKITTSDDLVIAEALWQGRLKK
ncbi:MAG: 2-C-methyl-D-erythritol 4-phosphate cytidylyltransferase [Chloroflexota bacterium]